MNWMGKKANLVAFTRAGAPTILKVTWRIACGYHVDITNSLGYLVTDLCSDKPETTWLVAYQLSKPEEGLSTVELT
jgi:hypothetical protein